MSATNKGKILIIEDERRIADITRAYLEREGYQAAVAETGEQALALLKQDHDLVILDLMLPDMAGEEICTLLRENSDVPIIMVTAKSAEEEKVKGLHIGADDYVVKPFSPRELVARVNALLRRTRKPVRVLSFNGGILTINVQNHEVQRDGAPVTLTPTEFRMLQILAERPQAVLSRLQLVNLAQGYDFEGYERTVDAHIKNLRQKIEPNPREPVFIKTVYGLGYKFIGTRDED
ncbi:MAG: response regulator transcription factor [Nitrospirota bacterium]|jgi:DNA-binding response OmpR family regulator